MKPTHRQSSTRLYKVWQQIRDRCSNQKNEAYPAYGGRGIKVCKKWLTFEGFFEDMGPSYIPGLTIERRNNDGDYRPDNCVWETRIAQANNRQRNLRWSHNGTLKTLRELSAFSEVKTHTLKWRLMSGWPMELALHKPPAIKNHRDKSTFNKGSLHGMSKLTESKVIKIKEMVRKGITNRTIAKAFKVVPSTIGYIVKGRTWRHV